MCGIPGIALIPLPLALAAQLALLLQRPIKHCPLLLGQIIPDAIAFPSIDPLGFLILYVQEQSEGNTYGPGFSARERAIICSNIATCDKEHADKLEV